MIFWHVLLVNLESWGIDFVEEVINPGDATTNVVIIVVATHTMDNTEICWLLSLGNKQKVQHLDRFLIISMICEYNQQEICTFDTTADAWWWITSPVGSAK